MQSRSQQTRERLLDAALDLFATHGYHGASMRQIAEAADVALGGIYNHFRSKEEILAAVILAWHPLNLIMPSLAETQGQTVEAFLYNAAQRFMKTFAERPALLRILMIELFDFGGAHLPELFDGLWPKALIFSQRLAALDERLRSLSPLVFMRLFLGTLIGFHISGELLNKLPEPHRHQIGTIEDLVAILVHGLYDSASTASLLQKGEAGEDERDGTQKTSDKI